MVTLGIDYGTARIGVASSDALGMVAAPVETISTATMDAIARIGEIARERGAHTIVLGMPLRMDGSEGTAAAKVRTFADRLQRLLPNIALVTIDERLTTKEAHALLDEAGRKGERDNQDIIDQAAAVLILQDYLDQQQGMPLLPDPDGL